ncbi:MAG: hypothetical protein EOM37_02640 [Proteobacteria bacterium]|nr:hypothetical protein [Alphaproteobacteria bacterium]NCC02934.1 hypothetical protein [Pseudomonadota bacterium]
MEPKIKLGNISSKSRKIDLLPIALPNIVLLACILGMNTLTQQYFKTNIVPAKQQSTIPVDQQEKCSIAVRDLFTIESEPQRDAQKIQRQRWVVESLCQVSAPLSERQELCSDATKAYLEKSTKGQTFSPDTTKARHTLGLLCSTMNAGHKLIK